MKFRKETFYRGRIRDNNVDMKFRTIFEADYKNKAKTIIIKCGTMNLKELPETMLIEFRKVRSNDKRRRSK